MADILRDPIKLVMLIILLALEVPAFIILIVAGVKAWKEGKEDNG